MHPHFFTRPHAPYTHPHAPAPLFVHIPNHAPTHMHTPTCTHAPVHPLMRPHPCLHTPLVPTPLYTPSCTHDPVHTLTLTGDDPLEGRKGAGPPGSVPAPGGPHPQQGERVGRQVLPGRTVRTPKPVAQWVPHMRACAPNGSKKGSVFSGRPITHGHTPCHQPSPFAVA
jgi:hypothetical protein